MCSMAKERTVQPRLRMVDAAQMHQAAAEHADNQTADPELPSVNCCCWLLSRRLGLAVLGSAPLAPASPRRLAAPPILTSHFCRLYGFASSDELMTAPGRWREI